MCDFITGILAGSFELDKVKILADPFSIVLIPIENRSVAKFLKPGEFYFYMTKGPCACGTDLCGYKEEVQSIEKAFSHLDQKEKKYRKKGWGNAKIERWRSQQILHRRSGDEPLKVYPGADCIRFTEFFKTLFEKTKVSKVGLLLHFYSGGLSSEKIDLKGRKVFQREQLLPETLFLTEKDTINVFLR